MLKIISKTAISILFIIVFNNYSFSQKTNLSIQGGVFYGSDLCSSANQRLPSYQGTVSLLYNFFDKIDLITRIRYYSFLYDEDPITSKVLSHYGFGLFLGCRFYVGEHFPKKGDDIFYPYFEIFPGLFTSHSEVDGYTDFYESDEITKENHLSFMFIGFAVGTIIKVSDKINLDIDIDFTGPPGILSSNLGLAVNL
jgi:hypothetical protein